MFGFVVIVEIVDTLIIRIANVEQNLSLMKLWRKIFLYNPFSTYAKVCKLTRAYQRVRNVSFLENFAFQINGWSLWENSWRELRKELVLLVGSKVCKKWFSINHREIMIVSNSLILKPTDENKIIPRKPPGHRK